jgi:hypothetical protein
MRIIEMYRTRSEKSMLTSNWHHKIQGISINTATHKNINYMNKGNWYKTGEPIISLNEAIHTHVQTAISYYKTEPIQ